MIVFLIVSACYLLLINNLTSSTKEIYSKIDESYKQSLESSTQSIGLVPGMPAIILPKDNPFNDSSRWLYVSSHHTLPRSYVPKNLVKISVPEPLEFKMKLQPLANDALKKLFSAAKKDGQLLIAVSAYRSIDEQQALLSQRIAEVGSDQAKKYVALPGESEHATGLAVDINTYTSSCVTDANQCAISINAERWLKAHAPRFGFIIRYPEHKEGSTGISYEPWHLRYIGNGAETLSASKLTFDQFVKKVEPSLFK